MSTQIKNMLIGVFIIAACSFLIFIVMWLRPSVGDGKQTLYVRFANINKIGIGTRVTFAGRPVGEVVKIREIPNARKIDKTDQEGEIFYYELELRVDSHVKVYSCDDIFLQTSGLLGEKSIAIAPKDCPTGQKQKLITNQPIYAESAEPLDRTLNQLATLAKTANKTIQQVSDWIACYGDDMGNTMRHVEKITGDIADGKGTIGKLLQKDDMYLRFNAILSKADTMMNDINNYGILFHLNKGWQRQRTERANLMKSLESPGSFKHYFQTEVDQINVSMGRLSTLIEKAEESPYKDQIFESTPFEKDFAEFMREVTELHNNLELYNQQLQEAKNKAEGN